MRVKKKISPGWWGWGGGRPPPFITFTITSKVAVYAPAEWADTLTLFHLYQCMYSVVTIVEIAVICTVCPPRVINIPCDHHRVHTERQLPISGVHHIMMEKSALAGGGGGCTPTPFHSITITYKVAGYDTLQLRGQIHYQYFIQISYLPYMYSVVPSVAIKVNFPRPKNRIYNQ